MTVDPNYNPMSYHELNREDRTWFDRELQKALNNPVVFTRESFYYYRNSETWFHNAYRSETDPTMLVYTPSLAYGRLDRQIKLKPGRYLSKFFGDELTAKQIQFYAQWWITGNKPASDRLAKAELKFAKTFDDIVDVYTRGPSSCMSGDEFDSGSNPTAVYGAGDLAVAYLEVPNEVVGENGWIVARALTWPACKVFGRVYPNTGSWSSDGFDSEGESEEAHDMLFNRLKADGFTHIHEGGSFNGAKLLKIDCDEGYVMPYLDGGYGVRDGGRHWIMSDHSAEYSCGLTNGLLEDNRVSCDECGDLVHAYETYSVYTRWSGYARGERSVCSSCYSDSNTFRCEGSGETYAGSACESVEIDGDTYNRAWAARNGAYQSEHSNEWFFENDDADEDAEPADPIPGCGEVDSPYAMQAATVQDARQVEFAL